MLIYCLRNGQLKAEWRSVKSENWDLRDGVLHNELSGRVMYGYTYELCTVWWCARVSTKAAAPRGVCVQRSCAARGGRGGAISGESAEERPDRRRRRRRAACRRSRNCCRAASRGAPGTRCSPSCGGSAWRREKRGCEKRMFESVTKVCQ